MMLPVSRAVAMATALLAMSGSGSVDAVTVTFKNACSYKIDLYSRLGGAKTADLSSSIAPGASDTRQFGKDYEGHFRHGQDDAATLIEFSTKGSMPIVWYDISIIPPRLIKGSELCKSLDECKANSESKKGFNVPVQMTPLANTNGNQCREVTCLGDGCPDAYLFPQDDTKTHACNLETDFIVTFCPSGSAAGSATTTPGTSAPSPTTAPTTSAPATTSPGSATPTPITSKPVTPGPITSKPLTPGPVTSNPMTPAPTTSKPLTPAPVTPKPATPGPATSSPLTPAPTTEKPTTPAATTSQPTTSAPVTSKPTSVPATPTTAPTPTMTPAPGASATPSPALAQTPAPAQTPSTEAPGKIRVPDVDKIVDLTKPPTQQQIPMPTSAPAKAPSATPPPNSGSALVPTPAPTSVNKKKIKFCQ